MILLKVLTKWKIIYLTSWYYKIITPELSFKYADDVHECGFYYPFLITMKRKKYDEEDSHSTHLSIPYVYLTNI